LHGLPDDDIVRLFTRGQRAGAQERGQNANVYCSGVATGNTGASSTKKFALFWADFGLAKLKKETCYV
jgi:hypothetical protein